MTLVGRDTPAIEHLPARRDGPPKRYLETLCGEVALVVEDNKRRHLCWHCTRDAARRKARA